MTWCSSCGKPIRAAYHPIMGRMIPIDAEPHDGGHLYLDHPGDGLAPIARELHLEGGVTGYGWSMHRCRRIYGEQ
jgi:hypothetical protein